MTWDVVVLGLGGMGSAAAWHLARRGLRVLGLDQYPPGHRFGSSHGRTRIIRKAYFEDPAYVPLLERAYELWEDLGQAVGEELLWRTGGLMLGTPDAPVVRGALLSARTYGLPHELLSADEVRRRFPAVTASLEMVALLEPHAGVLKSERCVQAHLRAAASAGAEFRYGERVIRWHEEPSHVVVETARGRVLAAACVVTAGPWAPSVLADAGLPLQVTRQVVAWFAPASPTHRDLLAGCPVLIADVGGTVWYGVPDPEEPGLKAALHTPGEPCTADTVRRDVKPDEVDAIRRVLRHLVPAADGPIREVGTCLYTITPDGHFVIGRPPGKQRVVYAAGFSGHGFKFASVIGEILAHLVMEGTTPHPIGFLSPARFSQIP